LIELPSGRILPVFPDDEGKSADPTDLAEFDHADSASPDDFENVNVNVAIEKFISEIDEHEQKI
jgi:hypothetical protein